ncbi:oral cancer-overexpressed protein 1 [Carica papaya]|uniref:oral cancer-overexpressed protein 1 n=1 Tax=Carica papaya TaxID=3649 RepID=UPI000B8CDECB|nr:oral cancer-overexpressed protein 1 [Carica papaya]
MESVQSNFLEDIFDSSLNLEETHMKEGFKEGYNEGLVAGREDARQLGLKLGFETGELLGFYRGCVCIWNSTIRVCISPQLQKHIREFEEWIDKYPLLDPEDESVDKKKDDLRVKFNVICASLGVVKKKLEYKGYPKVSSELDF